MQKTNKGRIDLSIGGESWHGFCFGSWGRAREWALMTPTGERLNADDLSDVRSRALDLDYLQVRNKLLEAKQAGVSFSLAPDEAQLVRVALQLLTRELPVQLGQRDAGVRPGKLLKLA